jgi:carboxylesterase
MLIKFSLGNGKAAPHSGQERILNGKELTLQGNNGATVLLFHGLTGTPYEMWFLAKSLHREGYSVACPRMANHGEPIEVLRKTKWQECYASVRKVFLDMGLAEGKGKVFVCGLSVGALFALLLSDEFPGKISGVTCLSPTLFYDGWNMPWTRCLLPLIYLTPLKDIIYLKEEPPYGIKNETVRRHVHEYYSRAGLSDTQNVIQYGYPYIPLSLLYQHRLLVKYFLKKLPQMTVPVQLMQAKNDDMTSLKNSRFIYDRIGSQSKEIFLLNDSYHVIVVDQERETVAREMSGFFNRLKNS